MEKTENCTTRSWACSIEASPFWNQSQYGLDLTMRWLETTVSALLAKGERVVVADATFMACDALASSRTRKAELIADQWMEGRTVRQRARDGPSDATEGSP